MLSCKAKLGLTGKTLLVSSARFTPMKVECFAGCAAANAAKQSDSPAADRPVAVFREQALREQAQLGVADKVIFTGRVPNSEVTRYYDLVDVLVYPPVDAPHRAGYATEAAGSDGAKAGWWQPAMSAATADPARRYRRIVQTGDPADLARVVLDLAANAQRWPAIKAAGRKLCRNRAQLGQ